MRDNLRSRFEIALNENDVGTLENLNGLDTYQLEDYVRIGRSHNYDRLSYGFPFTTMH